MLTYSERTIPRGDAGTLATLREMARLIRMDAVHPLVRDVGSRIVMTYGSRDQVELAEGVRSWCVNNFTFVRDPTDRELLHSPEAQMRQWRETGHITGDCDDAAILSGALALAVGLRVRLVVVAFLDTRNPFAHTWAEIAPSTGTEGEWIECDVTRTFQNVPVALVSRVLVFPVA